MQGGSYLLLGFKQEVTDTMSALGRSLLHGFEGGLKATTFAHSIVPSSGLLVLASAFFPGRHLSPDHTAF